MKNYIYENNQKVRINIRAYDYHDAMEKLYGAKDKGINPEYWQLVTCVNDEVAKKLDLPTI